MVTASGIVKMGNLKLNRHPAGQPPRLGHAQVANAPSRSSVAPVLGGSSPPAAATVGAQWA